MHLFLSLLNTHDSQLLTLTRKVVIVFHVLLWILEDVGTTEIAVGLLAHFIYFQLLKDFPLVTLLSVKFISSVCMYPPIPSVLALSSHFLSYHIS